jgi:filamentous hemagglutinin
MRNLPLMTGVALIALASSAFASPPTTVENVQLNFNTIDAAKTKVKEVGAKLLDLTTQAVGNTLSVTDTADHSAANVGNFQVNAITDQSAKTIVKDDTLEGPHGSVTVNTAAVGNNASISTVAFDDHGNPVATGNGTDVGINSFQLNGDSVQSAKSIIVRSDVDGRMDVASVAVGNNLSVDAADGGVNPHSGFIGQINGTAIQDAKTVIALPYFSDGQNGPINVSTQAVGNNASVNAGDGNVNFGLVGQANAVAIQSADTTVGGVHSLSGPSSLNTVAVGNNLNVTADGKVDIKGGLLSGQLNTQALQTANTNLVWSSFHGSLDVSTAALGNSATVTATGGSATLGGAGFLGDDYHQINDHTIQAAFTSIDHTGVGGGLNVTTAAVGNNLALTGQGTAGLDAIQVNSNSAQYASTWIGHSSVGGGLTVNTQAIGNAASVTVK